MRVMMVRSEVKAERVAEVEAAIEKAFAGIHQAKPEGVRYASSKLGDGVTVVALLALEGDTYPLLELPAFREFQESLKDRVAGPAVPEQLQVIGSYRLFDEP
jgi:hypothetical protein